LFACLPDSTGLLAWLLSNWLPCLLLLGSLPNSLLTCLLDFLMNLFACLPDSTGLLAWLLSNWLPCLLAGLVAE